MKPQVLALALFVAACQGDGPHPGDTLTPIAGNPSWTDEVQAAIDVWTTALGPNCPYYVIGDGGYPVERVPVIEDHPDALGWYYPGDRIVIREANLIGYRRVLVHELGHGIFPEHNSDPTSIMYAWPTIDSPSAVDIDNARRALGCD